MKDTLLFLGQTFRGWRTIGALAPSGRSLSRAIAQAAGDVAPGQVILELGPGTGVITRELVRRFPNNRVISVEIIGAFATRLSRAFPTVTVVNGCASKLDTHLAKLGLGAGDVAAVVSGLPLLSLPADLPQRVLESITGVLRPRGRYVQFTYSARAWQRFTLDGFRRHSQRKVWLNFPPAHVLTFEREG